MTSRAVSALCCLVSCTGCAQAFVQSGVGIGAGSRSSVLGRHGAGIAESSATRWLSSHRSPREPPQHSWLAQLRTSTVRHLSFPPSDGLLDEGVKAHGKHICLDYTCFHVDDAKLGGELTLMLMRNAVLESGVREVHSKVVILGEEGESPPGFTAVCLVDESHVTAHCYSDRGWLAIDVFTCGSHPPEVLATKLHEALIASVPGLKLQRGVVLDRFLYRADQPADVIEERHDRGAMVAGY